MRRRIACVGDELERGGKILPNAGRGCTFGNPGHQAALIGGQAYCEACKSTGTIAKASGPRRMQFMGEIALDGDIVLCRCPTPPRIVARLAGEKWFEDMAARDGASAAISPHKAYLQHPTRGTTNKSSSSTSRQGNRWLASGARKENPALCRSMSKLTPFTENHKKTEKSLSMVLNKIGREK
ncbi:PAAR domain-containing protein [Cupriavidus basilensis]